MAFDSLIYLGREKFFNFVQNMALKVTTAALVLQSCITKYVVYL